MLEDFLYFMEELKSSKGWNSTKRVIIGIVSFIFLLIVCFNSTYTLKDNEQAVVTTFGNAKLVETAGLNFKIPFIQKVKKVNTSILGVTIGYTYDENGNLITLDDEATMITKDYNFVSVDFHITYQVSDPVAYLYAANNPLGILKNMSQNCIRATIASYNVDSVLTTGKNEIQANVKEMLMKKLDNYKIGISLRDVNIQDSEPPTEEVRIAFKNVETAKQGKETTINNAKKYANELLPKAQADADKIIKDAEAVKTSKINDAKGQAARFNSLYEEYKNYPLITKERMFYETMEELLPDMKVIIQGDNGKTQTILPLESFAGN